MFPFLCTMQVQKQFSVCCISRAKSKIVAAFSTGNFTKHKDRHNTSTNTPCSARFIHLSNLNHTSCCRPHRTLCSSHSWSVPPSNLTCTVGRRDILSRLMSGTYPTRPSSLPLSRSHQAPGFACSWRCTMIFSVAALLEVPDPRLGADLVHP
jgi:hypothetical protein